MLGTIYNLVYYNKKKLIKFETDNIEISVHLYITINLYNQLKNKCIYIFKKCIQLLYALIIFTQYYKISGNTVKMEQNNNKNAFFFFYLILDMVFRSTK